MRLQNQTLRQQALLRTARETSRAEGQPAAWSGTRRSEEAQSTHVHGAASAAGACNDKTLLAALSRTSWLRAPTTPTATPLARGKPRLAALAAPAHASTARAWAERRGTPGAPAGASAAASAFFFSFFLALSRARAVVDSTAVGTLAAAAAASCVTGGGYANSDALHLHATCAAATHMRLAWLRAARHAQAAEEHGALLRRRHACQW